MRNETRPLPPELAPQTAIGAAELAIQNATPPVQTGQRPSERSMERVPARDYYRNMARVDPAPSGELKYHIDPEDFVPDCDHEWVAVTVNGMQTGALGRAIDRGFVTARACDFPRLSGFGKTNSAALQRAGYGQQVQAEDVVLRDGQMLMIRPAELAARADDQRIRQAREQVDTQMRRLEMVSKRHLGERSGRGGTEVRYGRPRQFANTELDQAFGSDGEP